MIGKPIDNTFAYVVKVDEDGNTKLELCGVDEPGELLIGGAGVTRGYLGRDDLTAERYLPDTFAGAGRMYRTGDLVKWTPSGDLMCLGRIDSQIKLRGYRYVGCVTSFSITRDPGSTP